MNIDINGTIVSNDDQQIYDWLGVDAVSPRSVAGKLNESKDKEIIVNINSGGGDVFAGSEIYTALKNHKGKVNINITGIAASAASVIAMSGDVVNISPTAQIMIHNVSSVASGDYRDMEHEAGVIKNYNKSIANAYILKTGESKADILKMMDKETWLTAEQAVELGFADNILFDKDKKIENKQGYKLVASITNMLPQNVIDKTRIMIANESKQKMQMKLNLLKLHKIN